MTPELTEIEKRALRGDLTFSEFQEVGISLFQKGLVSLDPLPVGTSSNAFPLTESGRNVSLELRGAA